MNCHLQQPPLILYHNMAKSWKLIPRITVECNRSPTLAGWSIQCTHAAMGYHYSVIRTDDALTKIFSQRLHSCPGFALQLKSNTNDVFCCRCHRKKKSPRHGCGLWNNHQYCNSHKNTHTSPSTVHGVYVWNTGLILPSMHPRIGLSVVVECISKSRGKGRKANS